MKVCTTDQESEIISEQFWEAHVLHTKFAFLQNIELQSLQ